MIVPENKAIEALVRLGFKEYQAKVYCALAALGPASATEIHKVSGVPRPRVYDTLDELVKAGAVNFHRSRPVIYKVVDPTVVVGRLRKTYLEAGDETIRELGRVSIQHDERGFERLWVLKGDENIRSKTRQMLKEARKEIFVRFLNPERFMQLKDQLKEARDRKVRLKSIILTQEESLLREIGDVTHLVDFRKVSPTTSDESEILASLSEFFSEPSVFDFPDLGVIISDMRQSMLTVGQGLAVWFGIPLIAALQRAIFEYLWRNSERIK